MKLPAIPAPEVLEPEEVKGILADNITPSVMSFLESMPEYNCFVSRKFKLRHMHLDRKVWTPSERKQIEGAMYPSNGNYFENRRISCPEDGTPLLVTWPTTGGMDCAFMCRTSIGDETIQGISEAESKNWGDVARRCGPAGGYFLPPEDHNDDPKQLSKGTRGERYWSDNPPSCIVTT